MKRQKIKRIQRARRARRARAAIRGGAARPRLSVFRSHRHVWIQLIDDREGRTLASAGDRELSHRKKGGRLDAARALGEAIAKKAKELSIESVVFDRGAYRYHGLVRAVAEGARSGGLVL